jgi:YhcH/YjgK/YiaL family protein
MIYDNLANLNTYAGLAPEAWNLIGEFLAKWTPETELGRHILVVDQVFADVLCYETKALSDCKVELHAKYVDIQAVLSGNETILCTPTDGLEVIEEMDYTRDRGFFKFAPGKETSLAMTGGTFALFLPGEGHLTGCNEAKETIRKIVFKVAIDLLKK